MTTATELLTSGNPDDGVRPTVADAMISSPKLCGPATTAAQARAYFEDDHVHALLVVAHGVLLAVLHREDLPGLWPDAVAARAGHLHGRTVDPAADLEAVHSWMLGRGRRRVAVVDAQGRLLGLLCLKRSRRGFCSAANVASRACVPTTRGQAQGRGRRLPAAQASSRDPQASPAAPTVSPIPR